MKYGAVQPSLVVSNPPAPVYTIAYRANNPTAVLTGPPAATYVTAGRNPTMETSSFSSDSDPDPDYKKTRKRKHLKKVGYHSSTSILSILSL